MTFSEFILDNMEDILAEWERFAQTIPAASNMNRAALRDEAEQILRTIAQDMLQPQSNEEQETKSKRQPEAQAKDEDTAAELHAGQRIESGFDLMEVVDEFRALRASVIRLWTAQMAYADREILDQMTRFNEALDQALVESIGRFKARLDHSREMFLGMLGHDLRTPVGAILNSAELMLASKELPDTLARTASNIVSSTLHIKQMLSDLRDVTSQQLGGSLQVEAMATDLSAVCRQVVKEAQAFYPDRTVTLSLAGDLWGTWDDRRIRQMLGNLVQNAIQHGASDAPVAVSAHDEEDQIVLKVHNKGVPIPQAARHRIFEPLVKADDLQDGQRKSRGLGLGLYIAWTIARAHRGLIDVESSRERGTTFTVCLPRRT
jgi:signal transduction histidine kinase